MIELTEEQRISIQEGGAVRVRENGQEYVLLRPEVFERLTEDYDDSPWDPEDMDRMREESAALLDNFGKESADAPVSEEEILRRIQASNTYREWFEVTKSLPPDDGGYDIVKALDENRRWSGERSLLPDEGRRP